MPGDSPAGNRCLSGTRAQDGEIADTCANENRRLRGTDGGQTAWGGNSHLHEPDSPEQHIFTGHTPATQKNRRPENRRRLDLRAAQAMR